MGGKPAANEQVITSIGQLMKETNMPMLYWYASGRENLADYYVRNVQNIETHYLGAGQHYLQEDHPETIGKAVQDWRRRLDQ
jgi:haloalkane dehalogenase